MGEGIYTALTGAIGRQRQLDRVSHNLANADTAGHRQTRATFKEAIVDAERGVHFVEAGEEVIDFSTGRIEHTARPLDLAVAGEGFFQVQAPDGEVLLTRDGQFQLTHQGLIVNARGERLLDESGSPIALMATPDEVLIGEGGDVWDAFGMVAHVGLVDVQDRRAVEAVDGGLRTARENLMPASGAIMQGSIERSNVQPVRAMTEMITLQRHFEAMNNLIQTHHRTDGVAIESLGRMQ